MKCFLDFGVTTMVRLAGATMNEQFLLGLAIQTAVSGEGILVDSL